MKIRKRLYIILYSRFLIYADPLTRALGVCIIIVKSLNRETEEMQMDETEILNEIRAAVCMLDAGESAAFVDYLGDVTDGDSLREEPYEIAHGLLSVDEPKPLPKPIRDLIVILLEAAFAAGNADAMTDLGSLYYDGKRGFEQDFTQSVYYYHMAAEKGSRQAQENLGYCYYYGRNIPVNYEKAFHYFALGAFDGHLISLYKIGDMYANGYYVPKNEKEAFRIYERCMQTMTDEAAKYAAGPVFLRLGKAYLYGRGTDKDPENALICLQKAEWFLYKMVRDGDYMYKKSLAEAIDGQAEARGLLGASLPGSEWNFD